MKQKIIVTGASGGFGFLISKSLVENGHSVVGTMRSTGGKNTEVAAELSALGVHLVEMDVTQDESVIQGVQKSIELMDGLDTVINNAGIGSHGIQEFFTIEDMQKIFDVNVFGVQRLMRAILPHLRNQGKGTLLHVSSCIGRITFPFYGVYCASKWALEALAEGYRSELSGFGIESVIVEPGGMPTKFMDTLLKPSDTSRNEQYGDMIHIPHAAQEGFEKALAANTLQRPQTVATAITELLKLPFGEKPFRTVVDYMGMKESVEGYNDHLHQVTAGVYGNFGMEGLLKLNK